MYSQKMMSGYEKYTQTAAIQPEFAFASGAAPNRLEVYGQVERVAKYAKMYTLDFNHPKKTASQREMLMTVQKVFALNVSQLADVMSSERKSIYNWFQMDELKLQKKHAARLSILFSLAQEWSRLGAKTEKQEGRIASQKLMSALSKESIDPNEVREVMVTITKQSAVQGTRPGTAKGLAAAMRANAGKMTRRTFQPEGNQPFYVSDPLDRKKTLRIMPTGETVRGRLENGVFIVDEA